MDKVSVTLNVFFEDRFWIAVVERMDGDRLFAVKVTFGAEPRDYEVREFFLQNYFRLHFSPSLRVDVRDTHPNPKRLMRQIRRQQESGGIGKKSWQAIKQLQEENKMERKTLRRDRNEEERERRFALRQQKKKEKHRGR